MSQYLCALILAVLLNASANLLMKFAASQLSRQADAMTKGTWAACTAAVTCPTLLVGLLCFALNVPLYVYALQKFKVSLAYPIMVGGGFAIIVTVASFSGLAERLAPIQWLAVIMILVAVMLLCVTLEG